MENKELIINKINQSKAFIDLIQQMIYEGLSIDNAKLCSILEATNNIIDDAVQLIEPPKIESNALVISDLEIVKTTH
jgi:hypothetical protein